MFKKIIIGLLAVVFLFYCYVCGWLYINQEKILFPGKKTPIEEKFNFPIPFEEVWIETEGAKLHALYFKAANPKGMIIFFHGNSERNDQFGASASEFTGQGFDYLVPDYRGYGKSSGQIKNEKQFLLDNEHIWDWARKKYPPSKLYLAGRSLGAVPAAYLSAKFTPARTVLIAPFFNIDAMANVRYPYLPKFLIQYKFRNDLWVSEIQNPVYFIHGDQDETVPSDQSERLAKQAKVTHERFIVPGAGHNNLQDFPRYHEILYQLMNQESSKLKTKSAEP